MAYEGYLLRIGNKPTNLLNRFIEYDTYKVSRKIQDLDAYRNANGELVRNALDHIPYTITFNIIPDLNTNEMDIIMSALRDSYIISKERKLNIKAFVPELNDYISQPFYLADPDITIKKITDTDIIYEGFTLDFIGY